MTPPESFNKAVFLSYASQDTEAARRICEALRAAGVEVWFDQSELRGGEAWDWSIRRQIKECALFLPIVSANTQARPEGYFRLEWHLAEQRSQLIAKGRPYIVPVGIDGTTDREALVPDAFLAVQWTRLPEGAATPQFVAQVQRLLSGEPFDSAQGRQEARSREPGLDSVGRGGVGNQKEGPPRIADYDLLRLIGQGSYGDVWLARGVTGIYRAIKVVWRDRFTDAQPYEREFRGLKEFAAISLGESIQLALLHVGRSDAAGFFYYVMELADDVDRGRDIDPARYVPLTLTEVRARNGRVRVPAKDCLGYGVELARVLAGLHKRGLIHRDIKPSNVIFVGGVPKLADIGLVTPADATMTYVGTEGFVPPEGPGSASADVFALGRLLYELATGLDRQEFPQLPPDLDQLPDHRLLLELNEIILRACDPVPANRYRDGATLLTDLTALQAGSSVRRRRIGLGLLRVASAAVVVGTVAAVAWWQWRAVTPAPISSLPSPSAQPKTDPKSVAVLAFANLSDDKANEYFSDGISEELLTVLQKIPGLRVAARTSAFSFKGAKATATEIGQKLGVAHLVEGSVRRAGDEVRITVSLSRAATGQQVWSESFTRKLKDIFSVQSEIAETVVARIRGQLSGGALDVAALAAIRGQVRAAEKGGTKNVEAYEQYLQGRFYTNQFSKDNLARAARLFRRAVELDPAFALAWVELARAHMIQAGISNSGAESIADFQQARMALDRALTLVPDLVDALVSQANMQLRLDFDWRGADKAVRQAWALAPANPAIIGSAASLAGIFGQTDYSIELIRQLLILDPLNVLLHHSLANFYSIQGRFEEAEVERRRVIELSPEALWGYASLAEDYVLQGRFDEAVETAKKEKLDWARLTILAVAYWGQKNVAESDAALHQLVTTKADIAAYQIAEVYAYRRDFDQAFAWLERAHQQRDGGLTYSRISVMLPNLHADPRWPVFLRKLGLHDDQLAEFVPDFKKTVKMPVVPAAPAPKAPASR